jgi:hypothetical protein
MLHGFDEMRFKSITFPIRYHWNFSDTSLQGQSLRQCLYMSIRYRRIEKRIDHFVIPVIHYICNYALADFYFFPSKPAHREGDGKVEQVRSSLIFLPLKAW